jgi:hypothetical protein
MKRTRQVFHYEQDQVPVDISGCRMFHGEDLRKYLLLLWPKFPHNPILHKYTRTECGQDSL